MDTTHQYKTKTFANSLVSESMASIAVEFPLTLFINDIEYTTLLCSPCDMKALIFGLLKGDFLIQNKEDVVSLIMDEAKGLVYVELDLNISDRMLFKKRYITAGCASSAMYYETQDAVKLRSAKVKPYIDINYNEVVNMISMTKQNFEKNCVKTDLHLAVLMRSGKNLILTTDIECDQAIDKIIGHMILDDISSGDCFLIVSGRITSKIVLKCKKQEIKVIVSFSTPMNLAIKIAESLNIILIGFGRCEQGNVYTGFDHVKV